MYEEVLAYELRKSGINFERQKSIEVTYDEVSMGLGFIADFILENKLILELKSVEFIRPVHLKQLLTYLRLTDIKLWLLINFNDNFIKSAIKRVVNNLPDSDQSK